MKKQPLALRYYIQPQPKTKHMCGSIKLEQKLQDCNNYRNYKRNYIYGEAVWLKSVDAIYAPINVKPHSPYQA